ncbi:hypothetical protein C8R45DRAFT_990784 [Mycena sanguinolenta]|nr:hypothetical protein C8R45DRAFT_990784 [Mycena sanguinolenta]
MHPALEIFDIQERIFRHFYQNGYSTPDLLALACTCKTFQEPALDLLWVSSRSLRQFLNLFPQEAFVRREKRTWFRAAGLRPLVKADFKRFSFYANRVRQFVFSEYIPHLDKIFEAMAPHLPEGCLFPNLRSFCVTHVDAWDLRLFVSKKLTNSSMPYPYRKPCSGLDFIAPVAPILEQLSIRSPWHKGVAEDTPVVSALLRQTRGLRQLDIRTLSWDALVHLSNVLSLRKLSLGELIFASPPMVPLGPFTSLEYLDFKIAPTSQLFHFLRLLSTPLPTKSFHIGVQDGIAAGSVQIHDMLVEHLDHSTLCDIRLTMGSSVSAERIQTVSSSAVLRLHVFSNLTSLELHADRSITLTEEVLETLTRAWPRLQVLRLVTQKASDEPEDQPKLPLKALRRFAKRWPHLRTLELVLDTTNCPSALDDDDAVQTRFTELRVSFSPLADPDKASVARFLFHLFPNIATMFHKLNSVIYILPDSKDRPWITVRLCSPDESGWNGVAGHLQRLHKGKTG